MCQRNCTSYTKMNLNLTFFSREIILRLRGGRETRRQMSLDLVFHVDEAKIYIICKVTLTNCRRSEREIIFHCFEKATTFLFPAMISFFCFTKQQREKWNCGSIGFTRVTFGVVVVLKMDVCDWKKKKCFTSEIDWIYQAGLPFLTLPKWLD